MKKIIPTTSRPVPKKISKEPEDLSKQERELETATPPEFSKEKPKRIVPISKASKPKVPVSNNLISKDGDSSDKAGVTKRIWIRKTG